MAEIVEGFQLSDVLDEAVLRSGGERGTAEDVLTIRRNLHLILVDWNNRGFNTWKIDRFSVGVSPGVGSLPLTCAVDDVFQVMVNNIVYETTSGSTIAQARSSESPLRKISASEYAQITTKLSIGQPSQYYIERTDPPTMFFFPSGRSGRTETFTIWYVARPDAFDLYGNDLPIPPRWLHALVAGLAVRLASTRPPFDEALISRLNAEYAERLDEATRSDRQRVNYRVRIA